MTEKQKRFCEEYIIDLNATQAYIRAGYAVKKPITAEQNASKLLRNTKVKEYIGQLRCEQSERTKITADKVLEELVAIAFSDRTEAAKIVEIPATDVFGRELTDGKGEPILISTVKLTPTEALSENAKKAISGIKHGKNGIEVSSYDKLRALELIGRHLGMFVDGKFDVNLSGAAKVEIIDDIKSG